MVLASSSRTHRRGLFSTATATIRALAILVDNLAPTARPHWTCAAVGRDLPFSGAGIRERAHVHSGSARFVRVVSEETTARSDRSVPLDTWSLKHGFQAPCPQSTARTGDPQPTPPGAKPVMITPLPSGNITGWVRSNERMPTPLMSPRPDCFHPRVPSPAQPRHRTRWRRPRGFRLASRPLPNSPMMRSEVNLIELPPEMIDPEVHARRGPAGGVDLPWATACPPQHCWP